MGDRKAQDQRLVETVLHGDDDAYGELVERYQRMVGSVAWRYGTPRQEIEDVVSEVFTKAYRNLDQYRPEHAFSTWLYRLGANHVIDRYRRKKKEQGVAEMPEQVADERPSAREGLETEERADIVQRCLLDLPEHYREVLHLVYVDGMKVQEASLAMNVPQGTIKTRLMRGREALRKILVRRHPDLFGN